MKSNGSFKKKGDSVRRIASLIGVHYSIVIRKLNCVEGEYSTIKAQQLVSLLIKVNRQS